MVSGDNNKDYTVIDHMKSFNREIFDFSHFGIHLEKLRREIFDLTYSIYVVLSQDGSWHLGIFHDTKNGRYHG